MPATTGTGYLNRLRESSAEVYLDGQPVKDVTDHPAMRHGAETVASLYDLQYDSSIGRDMTYSSPDTGDQVGLSFIIPRTVDDLARRRVMMTHWARRTCGMMGRTPDFLNVAVMSMAASSDYCGQDRPEFKDNIENYYRYIRENDLTLTHTLVNLQRNRAPLASPLENRTDVALSVVKETD